MTALTPQERLLELAERVERATGCDYQLDLAIATVLFEGGAFEIVNYDPELWIQRKDWSPTSSLDAAMTLVPEHHNWACGDLNENDKAWACLTSQQDIDYAGEAITPALALTAAALRARASLPDAAEGQG